jgi:hypothetical protein
MTIKTWVPKTASWIQEVEDRNSPLGGCLYIKIGRYDDQPMGWEEIWERFAMAYRGKWAIQVFPPRSHLVNDANLYHLFVFDEWPHALTINRDHP